MHRPAFPVRFAALAAGIVALLALRPAIAEVTWYHADALRSPIAATDATGLVVWRARYRPFGSRDTLPPGAMGHPGFTGHMHDDALGLIAMPARYYDPVIGRFLATDPAPVIAAHPSSFSRYGYAWNNPYRYRDPDGELPVLALPAIGGAIGAGANLTVQLLNQGGDFSRVNWSEVAVAGAAGAGSVMVAGRIGTLVAETGLTGAAALAANTAGNAVGGSLVSTGALATAAAIDELDGDGSSVGATEFGDAARIGAVSGALAKGLNTGLTSMATRSGKLARQDGELTGAGKVVIEASVELMTNADIARELGL